MQYIEPVFRADRFTCPHCGTISQQQWQDNYFQADVNIEIDRQSQIEVFHSTTARCLSCTKKTLWINNELVFPIFAVYPKPNTEMPVSVLSLYNEAGEICGKSPRGACALLRLALQTLCVELGEEGKDLNTDVKNLVKRGLPEVVQQSLDVVRVVGNKAVHPGQIELNVENKETIDTLFELINIIVEYMIAMPNRVGSLYSKLPVGAKEAIEKRDK
jgi:putative lipoic acid-binding regulatory protein